MRWDLDASRLVISILFSLSCRISALYKVYSYTEILHSISRRISSRLRLLTYHAWFKKWKDTTKIETITPRTLSYKLSIENITSRIIEEFTVYCFIKTNIYMSFIYRNNDIRWKLLETRWVKQISILVKNSIRTRTWKLWKSHRWNPISNSKKYGQKRIVHFISKILKNIKKWQTFSIILSLQLINDMIFFSLQSL